MIFYSIIPTPPESTLFPYTTLFRSSVRSVSTAPSAIGRSDEHGHQQGGQVERRVHEHPRHHGVAALAHLGQGQADRKSTRLNSSHPSSSYAVFCLKKKIIKNKSQDN